MRTALALLLGSILVASATAQMTRSEHLLRDQLVVKLNESPPAPTDAYRDDLATTGDTSLDALLARLGATALERVFRTPPRGWRNPAAARAIGLERWVRVRFALERADLASMASSIASHPAIERCDREPYGFVADTTPNDPDFVNQYSLQNGKLNAPKAWDIARTSSHVLAIIDTGADLDHMDLAPNLWQNPGEIAGNGIDDDLNGYIDDVVGWDFAYADNKPEDQFGHGIHCSGIAGAVTDNMRQVAGVCWSVPIMEVQVFDRFGGAPISRAAQGIVYAADTGASVESNSWGYFEDQAVLRDAVIYADSLDVVIVAAAHNYGSTTKMYPAAYPQTMGIIATDKNDKKASWSNYGDWCDMAAPGDEILSLYLNNSTTYLSGTSMSTPHVAGAAALVLEVNASLDAVDARWVLNYSAVDLGTAGFDTKYGWGRLDLLAAVERAQSLTISTNAAHRGDHVQFELARPTEPGHLYFLLASRFGRAPGTPLAAFDAADHRQLPLNADPFLFAYLTAYGATSSTFVNFAGTLDANGKANAEWIIPREPLLAGLSFDFAYVTLDPADLAHVISVSTSVHLLVQ